MSEERSETPSSETSAKLAWEKLTGYFPPSSASDAKIFHTGLIELLSGYPQWVLDAVCNVRSGLPAHYEFLPSIAEIRQYCDKILESERRHRETIERWKPPRLPPPIDRSNRATYEELEAKHGPDWGLTRGPARIGYKTLADLEAEFGTEALADIPNHKTCPKCRAIIGTEREAKCVDRECPAPGRFDGRMAAAQVLGNLADKLAEKEQAAIDDEFDQQFGT